MFHETFSFTSTEPGPSRGDRASRLRAAGGRWGHVFPQLSGLLWSAEGKPVLADNGE
jgi:hypothetical protein